MGEKRTWVFRITNDQLALSGLVNMPLGTSAKAKLTDAIVKLIGEKISSAIAPVLGWTAYISSSAGIINAAMGNTGFKVSISGVYIKQYYNKGGYYVYGWDLNKPSVIAY